MKKIFCVFLCALLLSGCAAPAAEETTPETTAATAAKLTDEPLSDGKTLKVLAIGNSFSNNTTRYLYDIAKAEGVENVVLGRLYIGGCSLERHMRCATNNLMDYAYYKNTAGTWDKMENVNLLYGLQDEEWDIITMQQSSGNSGLPDSYTPHLEQLIEYVNTNKTNPDAKLVWHMTWAYQGDSTHNDFAKYANSQDVMYKCIMDTNKQVIVDNPAFSAIIPAGTAVQNARTSYLGDTLTSDGFHLNTLGEFIGGYVWYATFMGKTLEELQLKKIPGGISLSEDNQVLILEAINNALVNPFEVTESSYK